MLIQIFKLIIPYFSKQHPLYSPHMTAHALVELIPISEVVRDKFCLTYIKALESSTFGPVLYPNSCHVFLEFFDILHQNKIFLWNRIKNQDLH